jgi:hypothetical protein
MIIHRGCIAAAGMSLLVALSLAFAQRPDSETDTSESVSHSSTDKRSADTPADVLSPDQWRRVDESVKRALAWLAAQQQADGSFPTLETGQPGVTSLCIMAFVSHGHVPGDSAYGKLLERAGDYVLTSQKPNGLVTLIGPEGPRVTRDVYYEIGTCAAYNHAISSLMLSEFYGMSDPQRAARIKAAIEKSLAATLEMQSWPKQYPEDRGGWRYVHDPPGQPDSDLSVTGWNLMFLRSARNAGFTVSQQPIDEAIAYVRRCFSEGYGAFQYFGGSQDHRSRGMAGAGILALAHAGFHNAPEARRTGDWILRHRFDDYNGIVTFNRDWPHDRYHYAVFNCCQGMYQLGGHYWKEFFPRVVEVLLQHQRPDGSWPADSHWHDSQFGSAYTTALTVMTLGAPNQLLPIFQR